MNIKIDHHLFGKVPDRDFSTLLVSKDFDQETLRLLELNSQYSLPLSILYSEKEKPIKYVFYKLKNWFVFGRGIDYGKDEFNRPGNFLFHNILIEENVLKNIDISPVELISFFDKNTFLNNIDMNKKLSTQNVSIDKRQIEKEYLPELLNDEIIINNLYSFIFNYKSFSPNVIWLIGYNDQAIKFLNTLFYLLPKRLWFKIYFNTLWNNADKILNEIPVICTLPEDKTTDNNQFSIKIDLILKNIIHLDERIDLNNNYARIFTAVIVEAKNDQKRLLHYLDEIFYRMNWDELIKILSNNKIDEDTLNVFYHYWKEIVVEEIKKGKLILYEKFKHLINKDDLRQIYKSENFLSEINNKDKIDYIDDFWNWIINDTDVLERKFLYNQLFNNKNIFARLLNKFINIRNQKHLNLINEILKFISENQSLNTDFVDDFFANLLELLKGYNIYELSEFRDTYKILKNYEPQNFKQKLLIALIYLKADESKNIVKLLNDKKHKNDIFDVLYIGYKNKYDNDNIDNKHHTKKVNNHPDEPSK